MKELYVNIWRWRRLAASLAGREVKSRYAGSLIGAAWTIVEPLVQFGLYMTVFAYFLGTRLEGDSRVGAYAMYLVSGLVPFFALQEVLVRAAGFARASAPLVKHVSVPLEVLFLGAFLAILHRHSVALGVVLLAGIGTGTLAIGNLPWLVAGMLLFLALAWGLGLLLVVSGAVLPDVAQMVSTGTVVLFFLTPVLYPLSMVPAAARQWFVVNPIVGLLELFRSAIIGGQPATGGVIVTFASAMVALALGTRLFARRSLAVRDLV